MTDTTGLIIGTYTEKLPHVDGRAAGLLGATFDGNGVSETGVLAEVRNPSWVTATADGTKVYAVVETVDFDGRPGGGVAAYSRDIVSGKLTVLNTASSHGVEPAHLALDPSESFLLVANYRSGSVAVFPLDEDGSLGAVIEHIQHEGSSTHPQRQTGPHAHQVLFDPVTEQVIIPDLGLDAVLFYDFEKTGERAGTLTERSGARLRLASGAGPRHLAFHPDNTHLFLLNELDNTLVVLRRDGDQFVQTGMASTLPDGFAGHSQGSEVRVSASGRLVFTSNRGDLDSIAVFAFDAETGSVSLAHLESSRGAEPRDFVQSPDGASLYVANQDSDTVVTFAIDESVPSLSFVSSASVATPVCLLFVP